jgi:hypothetical protein
MIGRIALKELLHSVLTIRFAITVLVCCLLMPISVGVLSNDYLSEKADFEGRQELEALRQGGKGQMVKVFRPVPQLMALFRGTGAYSVNGIELNDEPWNRQLSSTVQSPTEAVFPTVDLTFILGFVLSAMAVILSFDSLSGEKAYATLRLVMANRLPRSSLVIGKWIGLSVALLIPFLLGIIISLLVFILITGIGFEIEAWSALGLSIAVATVYLSLFILLGITVSAFTRTPTQSIFIGLGLWGVLTLLVPQLAVAAAGSIFPTPTIQELEKNMRLATNEYQRKIRATNMELVETARKAGWEYERVRQKRREHDSSSTVLSDIKSSDPVLSITYE